MGRHRLRIRVTEVTVSLDADQLENLVRSVVSGSSSPIEISQEISDEEKGRDQALEYYDLGTIRPGRESRSQSSRSRRSDIDTDGLVERVVHNASGDLDEYQRALNAHAEPGKRALLALRFAGDSVKEGLSSTHIARLLQDHFRVSIREPAIRMALVRCSTRDPVLVTATRTSNCTLYKLTRQGLRQSDALLAAN